MVPLLLARSVEARNEYGPPLGGGPLGRADWPAPCPDGETGIEIVVVIRGL